MNITQIKETSLYVQNLERTETFYKEKLGFKMIAKEEGRHVFFKVGSSVLLCFLSGATQQDDKLPPHHGEGNLHIAFEVPQSEYKAMKEQVQCWGITIEHEQHWFEDYYSFYFRDPDGHALEIVPQGMWD
ncbi:VOC family protein [Fodinibius salsisoli]|uniref:VOC family protein n=1 Tax=Fodinibius salsisoli TaxID=2820877 RepID=A0ABT3PK05_9BACT|nr:VOC family protein [Fodinibius salsisoli]MCW9705504.1 VOC family protein [Fodinibius salsisoli]